MGGRSSDGFRDREKLKGRERKRGGVILYILENFDFDLIVNEIFTRRRRSHEKWHDIHEKT